MDTRDEAESELGKNREVEVEVEKGEEVEGRNYDRFWEKGIEKTKKAKKNENRGNTDIDYSMGNDDGNIQTDMRILNEVLLLVKL